MVRVRAKFIGPFWEITKRKEMEINLPEGADVRFLINLFVEEFTKRSGRHDVKRIFNEPYNIVLLNGEHIRQLKGFNTIMNDGDTIAFLFPVGGG